MENKDKLSFNSKIIILDRAIGEIIELFLGTFLAAYFYRITQDNMIYISIYYIISWAIATIGAFLFSNYIKTKNKVVLYRYGTLIKAIYILLIIILKEKILDYIWLIAIMYGISVATTGFPLNMIESELVSEKERTKYMGYKSATGEITKIIIPIFLGAYITYSSYQITAILVFIFSIIKLVISCCMENKNVSKDKTNLNKFIKEVKENPQYPIKKLYIIEFFKGITVHGVLKIVISLLIIYELKTELNLGIWTSFFSICMIITMILFSKKYNKYHSNKILTVCGFFIITSFIILLFSINKVTIIMYNIVFYVFISILLAITDIRLFDYSNKSPFEKELNTEYFIFRELSLNLGRICGYIILLLIGLSRNLSYLKILFFCATISLMIIILISKNIDKKENLNVNES